MQALIYLGTVNGFAASAVASGEVTALQHELLNNAVKFGALEVQRLAALAHTLLSGAQSSEILCGLRHDVGSQSEDDSASGATCIEQ